MKSWLNSSVTDYPVEAGPILQLHLSTICKAQTGCFWIRETRLTCRIMGSFIVRIVIPPGSTTSKLLHSLFPSTCPG